MSPHSLPTSQCIWPRAHAARGNSSVLKVWAAACGNHNPWPRLPGLAWSWCICSSWEQSFTQTQHSIPNFTLHLCSRINCRKSRATPNFQGHMCNSGEFGGPRKEMIETHTQHVNKLLYHVGKASGTECVTARKNVDSVSVKIMPLFTSNWISSIVVYKLLNTTPRAREEKSIITKPWHE